MRLKSFIFIFLICVALWFAFKIKRQEPANKISPSPTSLSHESTDEQPNVAIDQKSRPAAATPTNENHETKETQKAIPLESQPENSPFDETSSPSATFNLIPKAEELFISQQHIPIKDENRRLRTFDGFLVPQEKIFFNAFQAKISSKKQTLRVNIAFNRGFTGKGQDFCLAVKDDSSGQLLYFANEREITLKRSDDPGYLAISIENEIFLQIFATTNKKPNQFKSYLSLLSEPKKIPLILEEKPSQYDGTYLSCENFW